MGLRAYFSMIGLGTALSWTAWLIVLFTMNPFESGWVGFAMFYVTIGTGLVGILTLVFSLIRIIFLRRKVIEREVRISFRHAVLCSLIGVASLILSASGRFSFWYMLVLLILAVGVEYVFLQVHRKG